MRKVVLVLSILFLNAYSQPLPQWFRMYDTGQVEHLTDVYAVFGGGYAACGYTAVVGPRNPREPMDIWVLRIDDDGDIIWSNSYGDDQIAEGSCSLIETDDGGFLIGGYNIAHDYETELLALLIDGEGDEIWLRNYGSGSCSAVIELKSGEFVLCGLAYEPQTGGRVLCINEEGEELWDLLVSAPHNSCFKSMRETEGGIILAGYWVIQGAPREIWIAKVNFDGELLWERRLDQFGTFQNCYSMVSCHGDGFLLGGNLYADGESGFLLVKINGDGEVIWSRSYRFESRERIVGHSCMQMVKFRDAGYAMAGSFRTDETLVPAAIMV